jgi:predicted esterase YcpF (UPF0227 family)
MGIDKITPSIHPINKPWKAPEGACAVQRILYCHGFASNFDPEKDKVRALATLAPVDGVTVDYTRPPADVFATFSGAMAAPKNTLIVGTSMGGFFAAWLGCELGLPFIAINPAISPAKSLRKHIGAGRTHFGAPFLLSQEVVDAYAGLNFRLDGDGTIVLDLGDEVIDPQETIAAVENRLPFIDFSGGSHRFDHMKALLPTIQGRFFTTRDREEMKIQQRP